jgi:hypothetical protein
MTYWGLATDTRQSTTASWLHGVCGIASINVGHPAVYMNCRVRTCTRGSWRGGRGDLPSPPLTYAALVIIFVMASKDSQVIGYLGFEENGTGLSITSDAV